MLPNGPAADVSRTGCVLEGAGGGMPNLVPEIAGASGWAAAMVGDKAPQQPAPAFWLALES